MSVTFYFHEETYLCTGQPLVSRAPLGPGIAETQRGLSAVIFKKHLMSAGDVPGF